MTAEALAMPMTVQDAAQAERQALDRVRMHKIGYDRLRRRLDIQATNRSRVELAMAVLEFVEAAVALAEAKDRRDPASAAMASRDLRMFRVSDPVHDRCECAWRDYQETRQTGVHAAITAARDAWRSALVDWAQMLHVRRGIEDEQYVDELRQRLDNSQRLDPGDVFPSPSRSRAEELARASRGRERRDSLRLDAARYGGGLDGWRPANS
jgi:hypothetical protein